MNEMKYYDVLFVRNYNLRKKTKKVTKKVSEDEKYNEFLKKYTYLLD
jgi:hypothetical protein